MYIYASNRLAPGGHVYTESVVYNMEEMCQVQIGGQPSHTICNDTSIYAQTNRSTHVRTRTTLARVFSVGTDNLPDNLIIDYSLFTDAMCLTLYNSSMCYLQSWNNTVIRRDFSTVDMKPACVGRVRSSYAVNLPKHVDDDSVVHIVSTQTYTDVLVENAVKVYVFDNLKTNINRCTVDNRCCYAISPDQYAIVDLRQDGTLTVPFVESVNGLWGSPRIQGNHIIMPVVDAEGFGYEVRDMRNPYVHCNRFTMQLQSGNSIPHGMLQTIFCTIRF